MGTHLVQEPIRSILDDLNNTLLSSPAGVDLDTGLTERSKASLHKRRQEVLVATECGLIESCADQPVRSGMRGDQGNGITINMEVGSVVVGDGEASTGSNALIVVVESC